MSEVSLYGPYTGPPSGCVSRMVQHPFWGGNMPVSRVHRRVRASYATASRRGLRTARIRVGGGQYPGQMRNGSYLRLVDGCITQV